MNTNTTAILNTPGYYYAIAYILSCMVVLFTNKRRKNGWSGILIHVSIFSALAFYTVYVCYYRSDTGRFVFGM